MATQLSKAKSTSLLSVLQATRGANAGDGRKYSFVAADIDEIDILPAEITHRLETLYLSSNHIESLLNIDQFTNLKDLSLAHNFIRYFDVLQPLARLENLRNLKLSGNKVTELPFYWVHILCLCSRLTRLDDMAVSSVDHSNARLKRHRAHTLYEQLRTNEFRNCLLRHLRRLLACHLEMHDSVFGKYR